MDINELTCQINGAVYEVNKKLGAGFLEKVYENALLIELHSRGLKAESIQSQPGSFNKFHPSKSSHKAFHPVNCFNRLCFSVCLWPLLSFHSLSGDHKTP